MRGVILKASHRLELGGDWSDLSGYSDQKGGRVINVAVDIPGLIIQVHASPIETQRVEISSLDQRQSVLLNLTDYASKPDHNLDPLFLLKATVQSTLQQYLGINYDTLDPVLDLQDGGLRIATNSTAPMGSGLGTSGILATALRIAVSQVINAPIELIDACWRTYQLEITLHTGSGWQDQIGGILPGIKDITYSTRDGLKVMNLEPPSSFIREFNRLTVLALTGPSRYSGDILNDVNRLVQTNPATVARIDSLVTMCEPMRNAVEAGRYREVGSLASLITQEQRSLIQGLVPDSVWDLFEKVKDYCHGARICGAGGGGFSVFFTKDEGAKSAVIEKLTSAGCRTYSCAIGLGLREEVAVEAT